jgi:hypothetical protein
MTGAGKTYARLDNRKICCTIRCLCTGFLSIPTTWRQDMKLLLTSVGSLVGRNILDVLDYPGFSRRSLMQLVGANSIADAAGNFRCDRCHLVPPTAAADYPARMQDILLREAPDLILCCRDEDTLALSQLKRDHPQLPGVLPVGTPEAAPIGLDKWRTWQFACKHALPFAESFMPGPSGDGAALAQFCERVGYPLIAKPARGAGSRGVCFIRDADDAQAVAQRHGYLFQEYVGDPASLADYFESLRGPPPLFTQFKDAGYYLGYTVIAPSGAIADIAITRNDTEYGHTNSESTRCGSGARRADRRVCRRPVRGRRSRPDGCPGPAGPSWHLESGRDEPAGRGRNARPLPARRGRALSHHQRVRARQLVPAIAPGSRRRMHAGGQTIRNVAKSRRGRRHADARRRLVAALNRALAALGHETGRSPTTMGR